MIQINKLSYATRRGNFLGRKIEILQAVSMHIPAREIFAIIGPNGAGKSTLIKTILNFVRPTSGTIALAGSPTVGFLPENPYYYEHLTCKELLWFAAKSCGMSTRAFSEQLPRVAATVGMADHIRKRLGSFSKGMTQRVGIAAAIIHNPDLVILDEPMSGLDPLGRKMVFDLIHDLKSQGKTILFCSHILNDVERLCDRVAIMNHGSVQKLLTRDKLLMTRKEIQILIRAEETALRALEVSEYQFERSGSYINVFVQTSELNTALQFFSKQRLEVKTIRASEATLEKIFCQIAGKGKN